MPGDYTKILIAIHGIGAQHRNETIRSVAYRFGARADPPLAAQPLGYYHTEINDMVTVRGLDLPENLHGDLGRLGFAEVFWADVPQRVDAEKRTLEETKAWARTVVGRARSVLKNKAAGNDLQPEDYELAADVFEEIIETVHVIENLVFLAEKAGLFHFDLKQMLDEYLGDVQLVTEFAVYRNEIVGRFHRALEQIHQAHPGAELYVVAHSEGTVVSFLGLVQALAGLRPTVPRTAEKKPDPSATKAQPATDAAAQLAKPESQALEEPLPEFEPHEPAWLEKLKGFMTIGSPIDKHLVLWEGMWRNLPISAKERAERKVGNLAKVDKGQIRWRNYYDYGDPVGFMLDTARHWLWTKRRCTAFEFCDCEKCGHDIGFARYLFPGKAHNDYWNDDEVFEHFITNVVLNDEPPAAAAAAKVAAEKAESDAAEKTPPDSAKLAPVPQSHGAIQVLSPSIPYVLSFLLIGVGSFIIYRAVSHYTHPELDPAQRYILYQVLGISPPASLSRGWQVLNAVGIAALISGTTVLARVPRLMRTGKPYLRGATAFVIGSAFYWGFVHPIVRGEIGEIFRPLGEHAPTLGVLGLALMVALVALIGSRKPGKPGKTGLWNSLKCKLWWAFSGMRPLILCGALGLTLIIAQRVHKPDAWLTNDLRARLNSTRPPQHWMETVFPPSEKRNLEPLTPAASQAIETILRDQGGDPRWNLITAHPAIWPVVLATLAFLYLWWLGALLFDLAFVWHRYIRNSVLARRMLAASGGRAENDRRAQPCHNARLVGLPTTTAANVETVRFETPDPRRAGVTGETD